MLGHGHVGQVPAGNPCGRADRSGRPWLWRLRGTVQIEVPRPCASGPCVSSDTKVPKVAAVEHSQGLSRMTAEPNKMKGRFLAQDLQLPICTVSFLRLAGILSSAGQFVLVISCASSGIALPPVPTVPRQGRPRFAACANPNCTWNVASALHALQGLTDVFETPDYRPGVLLPLLLPHQYGPCI